MLQVRVADRVPFVVINAVKDSIQNRMTKPEQAVESAAKLLGQNLARITRAHGCEHVAIDNAGFQATHLAVKLEAVRDEMVPGQIRQRIFRGGKKALVSEVMNRGAGAWRHLTVSSLLT